MDNIENNENSLIEQEENQETEAQEEDKIYSYRSGILLKLILLFVFLVFVTLNIIPAFLQNTHKPAIYLYSEKPTQVSIKLDKTIKYDITIPKYKKGWKVQTEPNGIIKDLQPMRKRLARKINTHIFTGTE